MGLSHKSAIVRGNCLGTTIQLSTIAPKTGIYDVISNVIKYLNVFSSSTIGFKVE